MNLRWRQLGAAVMLLIDLFRDNPDIETLDDFCRPALAGQHLAQDRPPDPGPGLFGDREDLCRQEIEQVDESHIADRKPDNRG